jgi:hypothetical protein
MINIIDLKEGDTFWTAIGSLKPFNNDGKELFALSIDASEHIVEEVDKRGQHIHAQGKHNLIYFKDNIGLYETPEEAKKSVIGNIEFILMGLKDSDLFL